MCGADERPVRGPSQSTGMPLIPPWRECETRKERSGALLNLHQAKFLSDTVEQDRRQP
jgi:hypothetical protein